MKKIIYLAMAAMIMCGCAKKGDGDGTGGIYGVITDKATGEPVRAAGVQLNPLGTKTVTGDDGHYEFTDIDAGVHTLQVTKTGYRDVEDYTITVTGGKTAKGDMQLIRLITLIVFDDKQQEIDSLEFGTDATRSFTIYNGGDKRISNIYVSYFSPWINTIAINGNYNNFFLEPNDMATITIYLNEKGLNSGYNSTIISVNSSGGNKEVKITAMK
jgi:hypothetical protein